MFTVRPAAERGRFHHGWLQTAHTFSFADYHDPDHMGFRALRVINDDVIAPGMGFGTHPHRDMEILTYVLSGALEHRDSLGSGEVLRPGEVQVMTAGTGIRHSEFNPSAEEPVHLYQIWLLPDRRGHAPAYGQKAFPAEGRANRWQTVASADGREGALTIRQDAAVLLGDFAAGAGADYPLAPGRHAWLQVLRGDVVAGGKRLSAGDGLAVSDEPTLRVEGAEGGGEAMLFELG